MAEAQEASEAVNESIAAKEKGTELYKQQQYAEARAAWQEEFIGKERKAQHKELKGLQMALEQQRQSLDLLYCRQAELSEENAALRDCLESIGILCGQAFLSRLHRRRFQRVLNQHPLSTRQSKTFEALTLTPELAVNIAAYTGPCSLQLPLVSRSLSRGIALCASQLEQLFPSTIYIIGGAGSTSNQPLRSLEAFRPDSSSWSPSLRSMRQPRAVGVLRDHCLS
eukprot:symbB.v1.2.013991.t1/scaffold1008.1/size148887/3